MPEIEQKHGIIGQSDAIKQVIATIEQVAKSNISVLIVGDSGVGKELVAKAIHSNSLRKSKPYIIVNCGAIPAGTIESELFGHKKGSFTGALENRIGYFEAANGGTIFLDEIGETPLETQVKLLRTLEQGEIIPVGENIAKFVDVRIVAATNKNLTEEIQNNSFRKDLYFRLKTVTIHMPSLSERVEDIPLLVNFFMTQYSDDNNIPYKPISPKAMKLLMEKRWAGNVRELKNFVQSLCVFEQSHIIRPETVLQQIQNDTETEYDTPAYNPRLPVKLHNKDVDQVERELILRQIFVLRQDVEEIKTMLKEQIIPKISGQQLNDISNLINEMKHTQDDDLIEANIETAEKSLSQIEQEVIEKTLEKYYGSKRKTARALGMSERTLYRKLKDYKLS